MSSVTMEPNPSFRDEESRVAYNESKARAAFGSEFIDKLKEKQQRFCGDWWQLAMLVKEFTEEPGHFSDWNRWQANEVQKRLKNEQNEYIHLEGANFQNDHLHQGLRFDHFILRESHFEGAILYFARFKFANLIQAHFSRAELLGATFTNAQLFATQFSGANLCNADFTGTNMQAANLERSHLNGASFRDARLFIANLAGASLSEANLSGSNVRSAKGLLFDQNYVRDIDIEGNAQDPWSVLRRTYTGPWFFVHLMLLVVFFAPYVGRAAYLSGTGHLERWALDTYSELGAKIPHGENTLTELATIHADLIHHFEETHEERRAVWLLLGEKTGVSWVIPLIVILYNVLRGYLTIQVSQLRDAEERSQRTPTLNEYFGLCHPLNRDAQTSWLDAVWQAVTSPPLRKSSRPLSKCPGTREKISGLSLEIYSVWLRLTEAPIRFGLFRLHLIARVLFWAAVVIVSWNSYSWARNTWIWVSVT